MGRPGGISPDSAAQQADSAARQLPDPLCPEWASSPSSDVHVSKSRGWFTEYTPFISSVLDRNGKSLIVQGVGTVEVPTKVKLTRSGNGSHNILRLTNVLHIPEAVCNMIGGVPTGDYAMLRTETTKDETRVDIIGESNRRLGCFRVRRSTGSTRLLKISGQPRGPTLGPYSLQPGINYDRKIDVRWPDSERERYVAVARDGKTGSQANRPDSEDYTAEEKAWLQRKYGGEFKFLVSYGLSIYKDEDRDEGRAITRVLMAPPDQEVRTSSKPAPRRRGPRGGARLR